MKNFPFTSKPLQKWFEFLDRIDLRRHLSDVENVLIDSAKKTMGLLQKHQKA